MQFLWGLTGQMKALKTYLETNLSAGRAGKIEFCDVYTSSRASATDYNSTRAAKIDNLDAVVSGRLGSIKAIYTGTIAMTNGGSTTGTATITAVNTSRAICLLNGVRCDFADNVSNFATVVLTNSTTVTAQRGGTNGVTTVAYTVIEFNA